MCFLFSLLFSRRLSFSLVFWKHLLLISANDSFTHENHPYHYGGATMTNPHIGSLCQQSHTLLVLALHPPHLHAVFRWPVSRVKVS